MTLDEAVARADLPGLVARYYPESGAKPSKAGLYLAVWRGERHPSFSVYRHRGVWFFRDHATGEKGNAWHFLREIVGLSEAETLEVLGVNEERERSWKEVLEEGQRRLKALGRVPEEMRGRGFTLEDLLELGFGLTPEGTLIPVLSPEGRPVGVKVRRRQAPPKYRYLEGGMKASPWHSPGFSREDLPVVVVEGELNAAIASRVFPEAAFVGVAGAENSPDWKALRGRKVFLAADGDEAGRRALARWQEEARSFGLFPLPLPPLEEDFCEVAGRYGREALKGFLASALDWRCTEAVLLEGEEEAMRKRIVGKVALEGVEPLGWAGGRRVVRWRAWFRGEAPGLLVW